MAKTIQEMIDHIGVISSHMHDIVHRHSEDFKILSDWIATLGRDKDTYVDLGYSPESQKGIIVQVHLDKNESFKVAAPIIEQILSQGFKEKSQIDDVNWGYRQITFSKPQGDKSIHVSVRLWFRNDSEICVKVECGTQPVYKMECRDV